MGSRRLTFRDERGARRRLAVGADGVITVGRAPECTIRLHARDVSRQHARITVAGSALHVEDLGSRNGTFVNGRRVRRRRRLRGGDVLRLGEEVVCYEELAGPDAEAADLPAPTPPPPGQPAARPDLEGTLVMLAAVPRPRGWRAALAAALRAITRRD